MPVLLTDDVYEAILRELKQAQVVVRDAHARLKVREQAIVNLVQSLTAREPKP